MPACVTLCGDASLLSLSLFVALRCSAKKSRESISRQNKATSSAATTTRCQTASIITALHAVTAKKEYYVHTYIHTFIQMPMYVHTANVHSLTSSQAQTLRPCTPSLSLPLHYSLAALTPSTLVFALCSLALSLPTAHLVSSCGSLTVGTCS